MWGTKFRRVLAPLAGWATLVACAGALSGCGHKKQAQAPPPPPPPPISSSKSPSTRNSPRDTGVVAADVGALPFPEPLPERKPSRKERPLLVQTGMASWYGPPYHNRMAANGQPYDMNQLTAAHRTLPLNSVVRVTNLKTGRSAVVRITDRGPFVENRIIDLSMAAAKAIDVWRPGTAPVKLEVLESPLPLERGGRWAVQMGGFDHSEASRIKSKLSRRYENAQVLEFPSPTGQWWVRVRVPADDRQHAEEVAHNSPAPQENTFLVRLD